MLTRELYKIPSRVNLNDIREESDGKLFIVAGEDRKILLEIFSDPAIPDGYYSKNKQVTKIVAKKNKTISRNDYDIVKFNGELYAVYKTIRKVKAASDQLYKRMQNLRDGSWGEALKGSENLVFTPYKQKKDLLSSEPNKSVGIINAHAYRNADLFDKQDMLDYFKSFPEVVIMDSDPEGSLQDHISIQRELAKENIPVRSVVFVGPEELAKTAVANYFASELRDQTRVYFTLQDLTVFARANAISKWDDIDIDDSKKEYLVYKAYTTLTDFNNLDISNADFNDLHSILKVIKVYAASLEAAQYNAVIAALIRDVLEKIQYLENKQQKQVTTHYIQDKSEAYQTLSRIYSRIGQTVKNTTTPNVAGKESTQLNAINLESLVAIDTMLAALKEVEEYKKLKNADKKNRLPLLEKTLDDLVAAKQVLSENSNIVIKKYVEVSNTAINYLTKQLKPESFHVHQFTVIDSTGKMKTQRTESEAPIPPDLNTPPRPGK